MDEINFMLKELMIDLAMYPRRDIPLRKNPEDYSMLLHAVRRKDEK